MAGSKARFEVADDARDHVSTLYSRTRDRSLHLVEGLAPEDLGLQSMEDASPAKWHLAHTSWFFEQFVLDRFVPDYRFVDERYLYLFNSYYVQAGARFSRPHRGLVSRPTVNEVLDYRHAVDAAIDDLLASASEEAFPEICELIELGCHHEMQHQELLLTDLLHAFSFNPTRPAFRAPEPLAVQSRAETLEWCAFEGGLVEIGHDGEGFAFDNEGPRHKVYLEPFDLAGRLVTNREWCAFMEDGGYERAPLWLSDGWAEREAQGWTAPLYWFEQDGEWWSFGLRGAQPVDPDAPVTHVSYYEADAFARWAGARLPREAEWEHAAETVAVDGNFLEGGHFRPRPALASGLSQMFGDVWQWTQSAYSPYPGFTPPEGAIGEYNGKFMVNQWVLRGASCATPRAHARASYRNFFHPHQRWQFAGLRLARDA
ncbi:ergothioneine biosynthesis protein EgtB [Amorphus orientalis]|uniref:Ergothioneine biosynthesis protein EgtB n=1 Tax=Amorphus orientalis TaxID=649198 RepID=A0AAE3VSD0_9HYPH|nr:ergothioneine biosynthesis protein EgtB [Amorphus orientalis]MDQ0317073.1 ergothioneine biosynthesis protein EgtB [Amorphus orientalis]